MHPLIPCHWQLILSDILHSEITSTDLGLLSIGVEMSFFGGSFMYLTVTYGISVTDKSETSAFFTRFDGFH